MKIVRYTIVTPVRNEEAYLQATISSLARQTIRPSEWIIVNDGSTDKTGEIAAAAAAAHPWIRVRNRPDRGFRKAGGGVMEAFRDGLSEIRDGNWEYLVKLDGDLSFGDDYFERCFSHFESNERLGIGGGLVCNEIDGRMVLDSKDDPKFHVRGAVKIYRRACWKAIGGLIEAPGWDTMDELKANMLGWTTCTFSEIQLVHHRETGVADGRWRNWFKNGRANYVVGYHPVFMVAKCARRVFKRPYGLASLALFLGFFSGYFSRSTHQVKERDVISYLRSQQLLALRGKKCLWREYEP
jgi:poly-beta-1,6-N-acetyl-D-glucosamine synthase